MIGIIATLHVQGGKTAAFEQVARELAAQVRANEPGVLVYELNKSRTDPSTYRFMEVYADEETMRQHVGTSWFEELFPKMQALLSRDPDVEMLDVVR